MVDSMAGLIIAMIQDIHMIILYEQAPLPFGNNIGAYYGYDYYDYWGSISFDKVVEFLKRSVIIL